VTDKGSLITIDAKEFYKILKKDYKTWSKIGEISYEKDLKTKKKMRDKIGIIKELIIPTSFITEEDPIIQEENTSDQDSKSPDKSLKKVDKKVEVKRQLDAKEISHINYSNMIKKYNLRVNDDRLLDFRETVNEMFEFDQYEKIPYDKCELDPVTYGKRLNSRWAKLDK